jgi:hypothetical protein
MTGDEPEEPEDLAADAADAADAGREELIFGGVIGVTTVTSFRPGSSSARDPIAPATARQLVEEGYLLPEDRQNRAPPAAELIAAAERVDERTGAATAPGLRGYVVPRHRTDARVTLTGITVDLERGATDDRKAALEELVSLREEHPADSWTDTYDRCGVWWD